MKYMLNKGETYCSKNFLISLSIIIIGTFYFIFLDLDMKTFAYDEIFTVAMIKYSYLDIWKITATDVHPPLYYIMLKAFVSIFGHHLILFRIFSTLGIISCLITGLFFIRKYFGDKVSLLFIVIVTILPVTQYLVTETRMYSWAMFFVLATILSAYRVFKHGKLINYFSLLFFGLCSAYTHYFALLGVLCIITLLFLLMLYSKKDVKMLIVFFVLIIVGYSFWLPELFTQISRVNTKYWINKPGIKDILLYTYYSFSPKEPSHPYLLFDLKTMSIALSIVLLLIGSILLYTIKHLKDLNKHKIIVAFTFIIVALLPIFISVIYSYLSKPIIAPRYITCYLGGIILGFSIIISEIYPKNRTSKTLVILFLGVTAILSLTRVLSEIKYNENEYQELARLKEFIESKTTSKTTFLSPINSSIELSKLEFIYPDNLYLFYSKEKTNYTTKPFTYKEVHTLPFNFDFFLLISNHQEEEYKKESSDFLNSIRNDYTINDSLIQKDKKVYQMRTIHRSR